MSSRSAHKLSDFPAEQVTSAVLILLELCHEQAEEIQALRDEIARLKGQKPRPRIRPSKLEGDDKKDTGGRRGDQDKGSKTKRLKIHKTVAIPPDNIPEGSRFKGYQDYTVQDIRIELHNIRYRLERWETPSGEAIIGQLPGDVMGHHFGATVRIYIIYQYHHAHVTQPLILEQLREWGIEISAGEVSAILTKGMEAFHAEKEALLSVGLRCSRYIQVDDTGARHKGKNGYCTHIGNEQFAYFASTDSKSRINFLALLRAGYKDYVLNDEALAYMRQQKLPKAPLDSLAAHLPKTLSDEKQWQAYLKQLSISQRPVMCALPPRRRCWAAPSNMGCCIRIWSSSATTPASSMCCCTLCAGSMPNGCLPSSSVSMTRSVKPWTHAAAPFGRCMPT